MSTKSRASDAVVIGAGVIGCAVALRLQQRGISTVLLDAGPAGGEASGAAAGILAPQCEVTAPGPLLDLGLASRARFPKLVEEIEAASGIAVGYRKSGALWLATPEEADALQQRLEWQQKAGLTVEHLTRADVRRLEPALGEHSEALLFADEAQVEPPRLVRALELAALAAGVRFVQGHARRVVEKSAVVEGVETDDETLPCRHAVLAAGAWSTLIQGVIVGPRVVRPMRGQLVELEVRPPPLAHVVFAPGGYLVTRDDGRIHVGSTMEAVGYRKEVTVAGVSSLLHFAKRVVPSLAAAPITRMWSGLRPATDDHLPLIGTTPVEGLHFATGHLRNGVLLAPITADAVAAGIAGEPSPVDLAPFAVTRLRPRLPIAVT